MAGRVEIDEGWQAYVDAATEKLLDGRIGPDIVSDARQFCPKSSGTQDREAGGQLRYQETYREQDDDSPGSLAESIKHHMNGRTLIVSASGNDERDYAVYVELGHRVFHPSTRIVGPEVVPPSPFLRPALYRERGDGE